MKKTLFFAIMAGAALAGCVKNEEVAMSNDGSPDRIAFDAPVVGIPTRATEIFGNYPKGKNFAVYALYHEGAYTESAFTNPVYYMTNVECTAKMADGSAVGDQTPDYWAPINDYYWPKTKNSKLTFAAYAPKMPAVTGDITEGVKWNDKGFTFQNFGVDDEPNNQIDLLYSARVYDQQSGNMLNADNKAPYQGITIPFKHALSSILFTVKTTGIADPTKTVITLTGITVNNVIKKGTFSQNIEAAITGDGNDPKWSLGATKHNYTVFPKTGGATTKEISNTATFVNGEPDEGDTSDEYDTTEGDKIPDDPAKTNDGIRRSDLILIPQDLVRTNGEKITVTINYTIKNGSEGAIPQSQTFQLAVKDQDKDGDPEYKWEMGKRYIYHISIGMNKIYFNPQVTNWDDVDTDYVEIN